MRIALRSYSRCPEDPESLRVVDMENICEPCASVCFTVAHRSIDMERKVNVKRSIFVRGIHGQMGALPFKGPELYGYTAIVYVTHCQCDAGHSVSFQVAEHRRLWPGTKLYCLATEAHDCKRNAQDCCPKDEPPCQRGFNYYMRIHNIWKRLAITDYYAAVLVILSYVCNFMVHFLFCS